MLEGGEGQGKGRGINASGIRATALVWTCIVNNNMLKVHYDRCFLFRKTMTAFFSYMIRQITTYALSLTINVRPPMT